MVVGTAVGVGGGGGEMKGKVKCDARVGGRSNRVNKEPEDAVDRTLAHCQHSAAHIPFLK